MAAQSIIEDYASQVKELDSILQKLTREYCAKSCFNLPEGCCTAPIYEKGCIPPEMLYGNNVPKEMLPLQKKEALGNGWVNDDGQDCKYNNSGCILVSSKSPICIGHLCDDLKGNLRRTYPTDEVEIFILEMKKVKASKGLIETSHFADLLNYMGEAITAGKKLVEIKQKA